MKNPAPDIPPDSDRTQPLPALHAPGDGPAPPASAGRSRRSRKGENADTLIRKTNTRVPTSTAEGRERSVSRDGMRLAHVTDSYEMLQGFAEGGQGNISSARDRTLNRLVAIKSLKPVHLENEAQVNSFLAEAALTARLDHPSIVPLYTLCTDPEEGLHIAMKLVNGKTLREYLDETRILYEGQDIRQFDETESLFTRLEYFLKIYEAVSYAHNRRILHRDLKPENVMIGEFGEVYVMDWGIAITLEEAAGEPPESLREGTPGYAAPEVPAGRPSERSDIFALGAILFEVATLRRAITGSTAEERVLQTATGNWGPMQHDVASVTVSPDMEAIVHKAMHVDPAQRYATVDELRGDVHKFMAGHEVSARPDNALRAAGRWLFLHQHQSLMLFFGTLLLFASFSISVLIRKYQAEQMARQRQYVLANLQHEVNARAHRVDRHILRLEDALNEYARKAAFLLETETRASTPSEDPFPHYLELADLETAPAGTVASSLYGENVSLDFSSYKAAPGPLPPDAHHLLRRLAPLGDGLLQVLVESDPGQRFDFGQIDAYKERALQDGFPLRFLYIGLTNGMLICYPAKSRFDAVYDPRQRPWYENAEQADQVVWTTPYYDAFGQGLIVSASRAVRSRQCDLFGVASLDVTLEYVVSQLRVERGPSVFPGSRRYVIDGEGNILVDSSLEEMLDVSKEAQMAELQLKPYGRPAFQTFLASGRGGQVEVEGEGGPRVLACAYIPSVNWFFLEEVPLAEVDFREAAARHAQAR